MPQAGDPRGESAARTAGVSPATCGRGGRDPSRAGCGVGCRHSFRRQFSGTVACVVKVKPGMTPTPVAPGTDIDPTV